MIFEILISYSLKYIMKFVFIEKCKFPIVYELSGQPTYLKFVSCWNILWKPELAAVNFRSRKINTFLISWGIFPICALSFWHIYGLQNVLGKYVFSAPEPKAQVHYCDHALSVVRRPSSVRLSSLTFHIFDFFSETAVGNSTKLDRKQDLNVLYQVCVFRADRKNKMAALASDWLRHFRLLLWNRWTEFNETWQEARSQRPLPSLCFLGRSKKQDGRPGLWLAETFSTSPLKPLNGIQRNLTGSKISTSSTKFVFFGPIGKTRWPPWPLIGWDISDF